MLQGRRGEERVRELMKSLPADQMQILAKVYMEGKSHAEAAAELDLPWVRSSPGSGWLFRNFKYR